MFVGIQIIAPEGWGSMPKDVTFHFLKNDARRDRVLLAHFEVRGQNKLPMARLFVMRRGVFEEGAESGNIVPLDSQSKLPPWLSELEGFDLTQLDRERPRAKISHRSRVENRFLQIASTVRDFNGILDADDPEAEINQRAASCSPRQNETRFRLHVLAYLCFGCDMWVLLPPYHNIGHWNRLERPDTKFGAPSLAFGREYGNGMSPQLVERSVKGYLKRAKLGKYMEDIYAEVMEEDFHCVSVTSTKKGLKVYVHPNGLPFPTYWQFRYRVIKAIGVEQVQRTLYGHVRHRTRVAASKGSFTEDVANLMEKIQADGYYTKELPRGYVDGTSLPPLCVVTGSDVLSGKGIGIGFSFGAERSTAYRTMLFCMAVPKDYFCSLFGIEIAPEEWTSEGLPGHLITDRGPGARKDLIAELEKRFPIKDIVPSWSGQSKATVESSHPRTVKPEGQPTFVKSELTPVQLARREIMRMVKRNNSANMEHRFQPDRELVDIPPSPNALWNHYDSRFRNDAIPMRIDEAVRTFLTQIEFSLRDDGVWLDQQRYDAAELRNSGIYERVARSGTSTAKIQGYILDMCLRYIWVEHEGRLLRLAAQLRSRGDEETLYLSLAESEQWSKSRKEIGSAYAVHQFAVASEFNARFREATGEAWDSTTRKAGRPKRDATSRQEEREVKQTTSARKAA